MDFVCDRVDQRSLRSIFRIKSFEHGFIERPFRNQMRDRHRFGLTLPIQASVRLLIKLQAPRQREPHQQMPACLEVQSVTRRCWVDQAEGDLTFVPCLDIRACFKFASLREAGGDALTVMGKPVGHEQWVAVGCLDEIFEDVELALMNRRPLTVAGVDRAARELE